MTDDLTAFVYRVGEAVVPYVLDPSLTRLGGIALFIAGFWMLIVMAFMQGD
jgi:hypothetical protein